MSFPSPLKNRSSNADAETSPAVPPMWSSPAPTSSSKENVRPAEEDTGAVVVVVVVVMAAAATAKPDAEASPTKMTPKNEPIQEEEHKPTAGGVGVGAAAAAVAKPTAAELFPGLMEIVNGNIQEGSRTPKEQYNAAQTVAPTPSENRGSIIGMQALLGTHTKMFASYEKRIAKLEAANKALQATDVALQALAAPPVKKPSPPPSPPGKGRPALSARPLRRPHPSTGGSRWDAGAAVLSISRARQKQGRQAWREK
jgi:hypothetical protein